MKRSEEEQVQPAEQFEQEAEAFARQKHGGLTEAEIAQAEGAAKESDDRLQMIGADLQRRAEERVNDRRMTEERWYEDLRQFHAKYDPKILADIKKAGGSEVFVNITQPKTDAFAARMGDAVLPTDGKNWGMKITPVPELSQALKDDAALLDHQGQPAMSDQGAPMQNRDIARAIRDLAVERCARMENKIDDDLRECKWNAVQRTMLDQLAVLGTGVVKAPVLIGKSRNYWERIQDGKGNIARVMKVVKEQRPQAEWVDLWDFFPDMSTPEPDGWEDVFQRHYMTKRQLRALAKQPGFNADQIRAVIKQDMKPRLTAQHFTQLQLITGEHTVPLLRYEVWEYHGPLTHDDMAACGCDVPDGADPLETKEVIIWFCEGAVIKAVENPKEGGGHPFRVTWIKKDETSPFGFGLPRLMRHSQAVANAAWRMVMDNAGLAVAPMIAMALGIKPADGNWTLYAGKVWIIPPELSGGDVQKAIQTLELPLHLEELLKIFEVAVRLADEETSTPILLQGDRAPWVPDTAEGMSMLLSATSVVLRRAVKLYDDHVTSPTITGFYDWHMQFDEEDDDKGDYCITATGSTSLLEKERMAQNLALIAQYLQFPQIGARVKMHQYTEELFKAMRADHLLYPEDEAEQRVQQALQAQAQAEAAKNAKPGGDPNADQSKAQADQQRNMLKSRELDLREKKMGVDTQIAYDKLSVTLQSLAEKLGANRQQLMAKLGIAKMTTDAQNQRFNTEIGVKAQQGTGI
jgi:hypothetical protein